MKHDLELKNLFNFLADQDLLLSDYQKQSVGRYVELLSESSKKINLISKNDVSHIVERHILVSFYYVHVLQGVKESQDIKIIDVGTGAGLPGVILSICFPDNPILLLDSSRKKFLFLKRVFKELNLKFELICERLENIDIYTQGLFDIAVVRAVADIAALSKWGKQILKKNGLLYTLKGNNYQVEYSESDLRDITLKNMQIEEPWIKYSGYLKNKTMIRLEY